MKTTATKRNIPQHRTEPTALQYRAIEMMLNGHREADIADELKIDRVTVWRWRKLDPCFIAALNRRRAELWADHSDKLRALVAQALEVASAELANEANPERGKLAIAVLKFATMIPPSGEIDTETIVRERVEIERKNTPGILDHMMEEGKQLPQINQHIQQKWAELETLTGEPTGATNNVLQVLPDVIPSVPHTVKVPIGDNL